MIENTLRKLLQTTGCADETLFRVLKVNDRLFIDVSAEFIRLIIIGVIANAWADNSLFHTETQYGSTVRVVWLHVNVRESFQVFRSVKRLDEREDVSFIVLADYDPSIVDANVLETRNKQLIKWKTRVQVIESTQTKTEVNQSVTFAAKREDNLRHLSMEPYCEMVTGANTTQKRGFLRTVLSPKPVVPNAISEFCKSLKWTSVFVFHDSATEMDTRAVLDTLSINGVMTTVHNVDKVKDMNLLILEIYSSTAAVIHEINFVVLCRFDCVNRILKTANSFDAQNADQKTWLKQFSRWLVVLFDHRKVHSDTLKAVADDLDNVVVMAIPEIAFPASTHFPQVLKDTFLAIETELLKMSVTPTSSNMKEPLLEKLATWHPATRCRRYNVDTLLWTQEGREFSPVARVDMEGRVKLCAKLFPNTNYGYSKRQFIVATLPYPPFVIKRKENGTNVYEGTFIELLNELANTMNFTYKMIEPEDGMWGGFIDQENLIFNGLVGQLQRKEADIVAAPLVIQADREKVVDFSYTIHHEYSAVLQKKPDPRANKWKTLLNPFKMEVLISIGISLVLVTVLAFLIERYSHYYQKPEHAEIRKAEGGLHRLRDSFWYMYGALLYQGGVHLPCSLAGRTFVSTWWLFCIVVVGIYCGNLIAFLTVAKVNPLFNTLQEMTDMQDSIKWGTLGGTFWQVVFETSTIPIFRKIGDGIKAFYESDRGVLHLYTDYHINRVKEGGYAWIGDKTTMELAMAKECDLLVAKEEFLPMRYAFAFQGNSPHTTMFSKQIMKCHEGGLMEMWKRKWWPRSNFCSSEIVPKAKPITLEDVQSAFFVCVLGTFFGLVAFVAELVVFRCRQKHKGKQQSSRSETSSEQE